MFRLIVIMVLASGLLTAVAATPCEASILVVNRQEPMAADAVGSNDTCFPVRDKGVTRIYDNLLSSDRGMKSPANTGPGSGPFWAMASEIAIVRRPRFSGRLGRLHDQLVCEGPCYEMLHPA